MEKNNDKRQLSFNEAQKIINQLQKNTCLDPKTLQNMFMTTINWDYIKENPSLAYALAEIVKNPCDKQLCEQIVLDSKDSELNFRFAWRIPGADIKAHEQVVLDSKNLAVNHNFAFFIEGADDKAHEQIVLESKEPELNFYYARNVSGADINAHAKIVQDSKDPCLNFRFANEVDGADKKAHEQVIIDSKNPKYNYYYATIIEDADLIAHGNAIVESGDQDRIRDYYLWLQNHAAVIPCSSFDTNRYLDGFDNFKRALEDRNKGPVRERKPE